MRYSDKEIYFIDNNDNDSIDNIIIIIFLHIFKSTQCVSSFVLHFYELTVMSMPFIVSTLLSGRDVRLAGLFVCWLALLAVRLLAYNVFGDTSGRSSWKRGLTQLYILPHRTSLFLDLFSQYGFLDHQPT